MRIVAALAWYDEPPEALERLVLSLRGLADALVAADGPFALYGGEPASPAAQRATIELAAEEIGLPVEFLSPRVWSTQAAKRKLLTCWATTSDLVPRDEPSWMLVVDGDEYVFRHEAEALRALLGTTERDVAYVYGEEAGRRGELGRWRRLFRRLPNLTVRSSHHEYVLVEAGRVVRRLHGDPLEGELEEAADASELLVLGHDPLGRPFERQKAARRYYVLRNQQEVER